jgi:uncharacterized protein
MFKRKAYDLLLEWKKEYQGRTACLVEGARRVGKTTLVEEFAANEYQTYIKIDFSIASKEIKSAFDDISKMDLFFLKLQTETGIELIERNSVIIFDEVQLYPKARQAIKHLVKDGRYDYIETGSLISIKKNVKDILIPSEEHKVMLYPLDYEEFMWAVGKNPSIIRKTCETGTGIGDGTNRLMMRDFRIYMAVGGMPQAVEEYIQTNNLDRVDHVKLDILNLYQDDLRKIDPSGLLSKIYLNVPSQLALNKKRYVISKATGKKKNDKDLERLYELIDAGMVLPCYNVKKPDLALEQTVDLDCFKLYVTDIGLFTSMIFNSQSETGRDIYKKLLSDKLSADLGYMYENVVAQILVAAGRKLYYHTWQKENSSHGYEIDFLIIMNKKLVPIEVKSSATKRHESLDAFCNKYSSVIGRRFLLSQKDVGHEQMIELKPVYMLPFILN